MNRREFIKSGMVGVAGLNAVSLLNLEDMSLNTELIKPRNIVYSNSRFNRYKRYVDLYQNSTDLNYRIGQLAFQCTDAWMNSKLAKESFLFGNDKALLRSVGADHDDYFKAFNDYFKAFNDYVYNWAKELAIFGDVFIEKIVDAHETLLGAFSLDQFTMYRIETIKGKLLEFQQSNDGIDYVAIKRCFVQDTENPGHLKNKTVRFQPDLVVHVRNKDFEQCTREQPHEGPCNGLPCPHVSRSQPFLDGNTYPYGSSLLRETSDGFYAIDHVEARKSYCNTFWDAMKTLTV